MKSWNASIVASCFGSLYRFNGATTMKSWNARYYRRWRLGDERASMEPRR